MKILFTNPAPQIYGSERSMLSFIKSAKIEPSVVGPSGGELEKALKNNGIKFIPLEFGKYSLKQNPFWHLLFLIKFITIIRKISPDTIIINLDGNSSLIVLAAKLCGIPIIRFVRLEFKKPAGFIDAMSLKLCDALICPSDWVKNQINEWGGIKIAKKSYRLYDPYFNDKIKQEPATTKIKKSKYKLISVGRIHKSKRFDIAIKATSICIEKGYDVVLEIVGGTSGSEESERYKQELVILSEQKKISSRILFTNFLPNTKTLEKIKESDVLILSSESESFGMVLIEAWTHLVPTVSSDIAGCGEITRASKAGLLAPIGDEYAFSEKIIELLNDESLSKSMGKNGRDWVEKNCSADKYATELLKIAKTCI